MSRKIILRGSIHDFVRKFPSSSQNGLSDEEWPNPSTKMKLFGFASDQRNSLKSVGICAKALSNGELCP